MYPSEVINREQNRRWVRHRNCHNSQIVCKLQINCAHVAYQPNQISSCRTIVKQHIWVPSYLFINIFFAKEQLILLVLVALWKSYRAGLKSHWNILPVIHHGRHNCQWIKLILSWLSLSNKCLDFRDGERDKRPPPYSLQRECVPREKRKKEEKESTKSS